MRSLKKIFFLLLIAVFCAPSFAAVKGVELASCNVFSEGESGDGKTADDEKTEDEEPDCE